MCPQCSTPTIPVISKTVGSCIHIKQYCNNLQCVFKRDWASQPYICNMPAGNLLLSCAILLSGSLPNKSLRLFHFLNLQCISLSTFYRHQKMCLFPVVEIFWNEHQNDLMTQLKHADNKLLLIGDGRSDSPGHCAKYGTYTLIEQGLSKVVDIQLVQVCNNNFFYVISYK